MSNTCRQLMCLLSTIAFITVTTTAREDQNTSVKKIDTTKWKLVWQDEFSGEKLDESNWTVYGRGKSDWNNTASNDPRLIKVANGILQLRGIENDNKEKDPAPYLTGAITSKGKYSFKYGKTQIRARFKCADGSWPALWMLGNEKGWPANGEIDLMEHLNFDNKIYQTVHSVYTRKDKTNTPKHGGTVPITNRDGWNTYGCEWDADKIVFTVNGKHTLTYPRVEEKGELQWPFKQPFYFILSMQIGGGWVNQTVPTNPEHYPAYMEVDWVRVYMPVVK